MRNYGKYKDLSEYLKLKCKSFSKIKSDSINDRYISRWKYHNMFIPVDCLIELCKLSDIPLETIENEIKKIKYRLSPDKTSIAFPSSYNEDLAFLGEAIRVEGNIKKNLFHCSIANLDVDFVKKTLNCIEKCGIPKRSLYLYLKIEAEIPEESPTQVVSGGKTFKFNIRHPSKSSGFKRKINFIDKFDFGVTKTYEIEFNDRKICLDINVPQNGKIASKSNYKNSSAVCSITIANMTFCKLMNSLLEIPTGKKSEIIHIPKILDLSPLTVKNSAINSVLGAESTVEVTGKRIRIGMNSEIYLKGLKKILKDFEIDANLEKSTSLSITGNENLNKILSNFDFISIDKNMKLKSILQSYKIKTFRKNEGLRKILLILHKNGPKTAYEMSYSIGKHKDTVFLHLNKGTKTGLILKNTNEMPYKYSISDKGLEILGESNDLFRN